MLKRLFPFVTAAALLGASVLANAGAYYGYPVYVAQYPSGNSYAQGTLQATRSSGDNVQWIGCHVGLSADYSWVSCGATDPTYNATYCYSTNPTLIAAVGTINESSFLSFNANPYGECTNISVSNNSSNLDPS